MKRSLLFSVVLLFVAGLANAQNLIAHWPLDGDASEIVASKDATTSGGVSWVTDPERGSVALLDGVDGLINLPAEIWTDENSANTTITGWFKWSGGANWQRYYSLGSIDTWKLMYFTPKDGDGSMRLTFKTLEPDTWTEYKDDSFTNFSSIATDEWVFTALVINEGAVELWINDTKILETESISVTPQGIQDVNTNVNVIGGSHWADATFNGMVDDFRIYGEALTEEQIQGLYSGEANAIEDLMGDAAVNFYSVDGKIFYTLADEVMVSNVAVYNLAGVKVFSSNEVADITNCQFETGVYLVSVTNSKGTFTQKVAVIE